MSKVLNTCVACKNVHGPPGTARMANLPADRVTSEKPVFSSLDCDYFGPFTVKNNRKYEKIYGCIFTCLMSRAVHEVHQIQRKAPTHQM